MSKPKPVFGMVQTNMEADPNFDVGLPSGRSYTPEDLKAIFTAGGLQTYELICELKRLIKIGAVDLNPKNAALLAKAEKDVKSVVVGDDKKKAELKEDGKNIILAIIQEISGADTNFSAKKLQESDVIDVEVTPIDDEEVTERLARFKEHRDKKIIDI